MNNQTAIAGAVVLSAVVIIAFTRRGMLAAADMETNQADSGGMDALPDEASQETSTIDDVIVAVTPSTYMTGNVSDDTAQANIGAFLDMISYSEGTAKLADRGYAALFGGGQFYSYADHPRQYFTFTDKTGKTNKTSAAGRYQFLARTWDDLKGKLNLADFSPESQDAACLELIRQRGALNDVKAGRLQDAITKCAPIWASLPGAGYNQPERKLSTLVAAYNNAGGTVLA